MAASDTRAIYGNALILPSKKKETWVIKDNAAGEFSTTQIAFTSNGQKFTSIGANDSSGVAMVLYYDNTEVAGYDLSGGVYEFALEAYRKLTFDTPPTGDLLTWLQSNAVKQPDDTAVQDTKALTITSNGTVSVTPDAPYDALKKVDVTVNVASGGGSGEITSVDVYGRSDTLNRHVSCIWQTENGWVSTNEFSVIYNDFLFTIENVLVGGYIIFTKDPTDSAFFHVEDLNGVEVLDVNPAPGSMTTITNASIVIKVIDMNSSFRLSINSV